MKKIILNAVAVAMFFTSCDLKTEIDVESAAFPPKLCVTAILDGASGTFSIVLTEGRALADYKTPRLPEKELIRNGEIHLYENDYLILSEVGEFDMTTPPYHEPYFDLETHEYIFPEKGCYRFNASGISTHPGSTYRLEVEVDGYKKVTSTSTMPLLPDVSAIIDTTVAVIKERIKEYSSLAGWSSGGSGGLFTYWPVSLQWGERTAERNYYSLDMYTEKTALEGVPQEWWNQEGKFNLGIFVTDLTKLQDNPEVEIFESQGIDLDVSSMDNDVYLFPILLMSDVGFTNDNASLTLYKRRPDRLIDDNWEESITEWYPLELWNLIILQHTVSLRVRHITEATFKYYRSLVMQSIGMDFFSEPVNIKGNIENGYGGFTVFSAVDIPLIEYITYSWEWKGE